MPGVAEGMNSAEMEFWDGRYRAEHMPWDFRGVPRALVQWLQKCERPGRVLIPGCGSGYEVKAFAEHGWEVLAVDFSPAAVRRARAVLGALGERVMLADFFRGDFGRRKFDVVYERTFLCALPPERWPDYVRCVEENLVEGGRLVGFFFYGKENQPPPFPLTEERARSLFGEFSRTVDEVASDSLPLYAGYERWQVWQRKGASVA